MIISPPAFLIESSADFENLFASILIGELIRLNAVRYAGGATRTRNVGAPFLCTSGPYSRTRNPLYCGNIIIYTGVAFLGGGDFMWGLVLLVGFFFVLQYYLEWF